MTDTQESPGQRSGLRERKKAMTRQAISDVATRLFMDRGFEAVTVAEVAETAGVSVKTIFNYFGSKEDLYFDRDAELRGAIVEAITGRPPGRSITESLAELLAEHRIPDGCGWAMLHEPGGYRMFRKFLGVWQASPALQARRLVWDKQLQADLRDALAAELELAADSEPVRTMAAMLAAAIALRHATLAESILAGRPAADVEREVRAVTGEAMRRVAGAFPDLDVRRTAAS